MAQLSLSRRRFLQLAGLGIAGLALPRGAWSAEAATRQLRLGRILPADRKLNLACVGCGGMGGSDINAVSSENIIALCDVDDKRAEGTRKKHPNAKAYKDYRVMLQEMDEQIDGVVVSTPDHMHAPIALLAMSMGKHVYVQKPLAHTIAEVREMTLAARKHQVITQMGTQGHAEEGTKLIKEWVQAGAIGTVNEIHLWTSKSWSAFPRLARPTETTPIPDGFDWNLWQGVAAEQGHHNCYHPGKWRGWWDYGCGTLGDMACHLFDAPFYALDLTYPDSVEAESIATTADGAPRAAMVTYRFPAHKGRAPVKVVWFDGFDVVPEAKRPPRPKDLEEAREFKIKDTSGMVMYGDKGTLLSFGSIPSSPRIIPEEKMKEFAKNKPPKTLPRAPKGHYQEWIAACKGGQATGSTFDYSGPLSEMVLLGNLAIRTGKPVSWDAEKLLCTNVPEANRFVRKTYRAF